MNEESSFDLKHISLIMCDFIVVFPDYIGLRLHNVSNKLTVRVSSNSVHGYESIAFHISNKFTENIYCILFV